MQVASGRDVLLSSVPVDKPPLAIYAMAMSMAVFGRSEIAARLPSLIASTCCVALIWFWVRRLYPSSLRLRSGQALIPHPSSFATLLMALSPFNIAFGGTAFLDPLMVMWGLAACVAAAHGRAGWGGVFLGLATATKVQGLLFLPLVVISTTETRRTQRNVSVLSISPWFKFIAGFGAIAVWLLVWSLARGGTPFWIQQTINYGGLRAAFASELAPRLTGWLGFLPHFFGPIVGAIGAMGIVTLLVDGLTLNARVRPVAIDLLLITYALGFLGLHWLLAFPVWDRYLLILVPVGAVLAGRFVGWLVGWLLAPRSAGLASWMSRRSQRSNYPTIQLASAVLVVALMLPFTLRAVRSEIPVGGDRGSHDGIDRVETFLRGLPDGTVMYDHWLGWELDFYTWGAALYRSYFETPADLARDLRVFGRTSTRYLVAPADEPLGKIERAIGVEGFELRPMLTTTNRLGQTSFVVYRIASR